MGSNLLGSAMAADCTGMSLVAAFLILLAAACFWLGTAIGNRYQLSSVASITSLTFWGVGLVSRLVALVILVRVL